MNKLNCMAATTLVTHIRSYYLNGCVKTYNFETSKSNSALASLRNDYQKQLSTVNLLNFWSTFSWPASQQERHSIADHSIESQTSHFLSCTFITFFEKQHYFIYQKGLLANKFPHMKISNLGGSFSHRGC